MSVLVLHGRNSVDIDDRIRTVASPEHDPAGLNATSLDLSETELPDILAALTTPGFFGQQRVVILRGLPGVDRPLRVEWDDLEPVLSHLPPETIAILVTLQKIPSNRKVMKTARSRKWDVELHDVRYGRDLLDWVAGRAAIAGGSIDQEACRALLDRLFPSAWLREDRWNPRTINMRHIATEIEKLVSGSIDGIVTIESVKQLVADRSSITAFKLNDETFEGRANGALKELDNILADGEAPERVIGQLGYQPLVLYAAGLVQRYGPDTVSDASGISSGQLKATVGRKTAWKDRNGQSEAVEVLRHMEWLVKTGRAQTAGSVLTPGVAEIADAFTSKRG